LKAFARQHFGERAVGGAVDDDAGSFAPSCWVASTTVSRKFGSGIPGLAIEENRIDRALRVGAAVAKARRREKRGTAR